MRFENKTAVIASSEGTLGRALAAHFIKEGAKAALLTSDTLENGAEDTENALTVRICDFADEDELLKAGAAVSEKLGPADILVTALFCAAPDKAWDETTSKEAHTVVRNVLTGTRVVIKTFLPDMVSRESGRVAIVMPVTGRTNVPGMPWPEALSYAGLGGIIRNGATVFGKNSVTFNGVAVGPAESLGRSACHLENAAGFMNRKASDDDIAYAVMYLTDDEAAWNTGEIIDLNGGYFAN